MRNVTALDATLSNVTFFATVKGVVKTSVLSVSKKMGIVLIVKLQEIIV